MNRRGIHSNLSTFLFSTFHIVDKHPVYLYSSRLRRRFRRSILTAGVPPPTTVTCVYCILPYWSYTSPSIFTLRDFVAAFAGLFRRRLCDSPPIIYYPEMAHITIIESHYALLMLSLFSFSNFFYDITHFIHFK